MLFIIGNIVFSIIMSVRETCADWPRQFDPVQDPVLKGKKDPDTGFNIKVPRRNVGKQFLKIIDENNSRTMNNF